MGHVLLGELPRTRRWTEVVELIGAGAGAGQVAAATICAAEKGLAKAANDAGVVEAFWLMIQIPLAARESDFAGALRTCDLSVADRPTLFEIASAVADRLDSTSIRTTSRSDLSEMAQAAAAETLTTYMHERTKSLFGTTPEDVQRRFAEAATVKEFGLLAKTFYARFLNRALGYFVSRTLPEHVGEGKRFENLGQQRAFVDALAQHCRDASKIVERYSGEWASKRNWETGGAITREETKGFVGYGMKKLLSELKRGADADER